MDAALVKTRYENIGVRCYLKGDHMNTIHPGHSLWRGVEVQIREEDLALARDLYQKIETELGKIEICKACGEEGLIQLISPKTSNPLSNFVKMITYDFYHSSRGTHVCSSCGERCRL